MNDATFAQQFIDTIHSVEQRCMAADGPVTPTCNEITDEELRTLYKAAQQAVASGVPGTSAAQEDTMSVVSSDGQKHHLFRTRAEEDAAVARSPLKVAADLLALGERVGAQLYECAECSQPDCTWRGYCDGESCPACGGHVVPVGVLASGRRTDGASHADASSDGCGE